MINAPTPAPYNFIICVYTDGGGARPRTYLHLAGGDEVVEEVLQRGQLRDEPLHHLWVFFWGVFHRFD